jgi:methylenetetrahydrofolate dehydrogenase (NADP+)/methenyltetrahydrofolate cyclohydrolase
MMVAQPLDGKACAADLEADLLARISACSVIPHLTVIIVGDDAASQVYVANKIKTCQRLGITSTHIALASDSSEEELRQIITELNHDESVHGILVQSPLPRHMDEEALTELISPAKDVDGFHPINLGRLVQGRNDGLQPCTPAGVMRILAFYGLELSGKKALVIGRSRIVGMPMAILLASKGADATVTIAHSRTQDLVGVCNDADIIVAAVGCAGMVTVDMVKKGAIIIDVGINRVDDNSQERGWRLAGDIHPDVAEVAAYLTPVPGGIGPMTIAMLMANTVTAAESQHS